MNVSPDGVVTSIRSTEFGTVSTTNSPVVTTDVIASAGVSPGGPIDPPWAAAPQVPDPVPTVSSWTQYC